MGSTNNAKQAKCVLFILSLMIVLPVAQSWGSCAVPTSPGVNICSPLNGSTVSSPFTISAAGKDSVTTDGMDVWLDGQKVGWFGGTNAVTIQQSAAAGTHQLDVFAVGTNGELQHASSIFKTGSGTSGGSCAVPTSPGVNICSPLNGSTVSSPFTISAAGKDSVTTDGMDVWLDGQKVGWFVGTNAVTIQQSAADGTHQLDVFAVGTNGELQHASSIFNTGAGSNLTAFHLSGTVVGDDGVPVANAELYLDYVGVSCGVGYCHAIIYTDLNGSYTVDFTASRGAMHGPAGTENAFAFANVWPGADYEDDYRYILAPNQTDTSTQYITQNFQLRRRTRITAGDSIVVTISPDDTICNNNVQDMHPWPTEFVCRTVRINVPNAGTLTIEALANQSTVTPALETEWQIDPCCHEALANPRSFFVPAGTEVKAQVEMPWGTPSSSFLLKTSIAP